MFDTIRGPVTNVVDGDTFDINVTHTGNHNTYDYNASERIRIADVNAPEMSYPGGLLSKFSLSFRLLGKEVRCHVKSRDAYGRVVADVTLLN